MNFIRRVIFIRIRSPKTAYIPPSATKKQPKSDKIWQLSVRRVLCLDTSGTPTVPRRGSRRDGASRAPRGTPQTSTRLFPESVAPTFEFSTSACKRRGRAGVAAEPLCASPRFRPLFRFSFRAPMALIIENLCRACTRLIFYSPQVILGNSRG